MNIIVFALCVLAVATLHIEEAHLAATFPAGQVTLQSGIGTYLGRCNGCGPGAYPDSVAVQEANGANSWAIWNA